MLRLAGINEDVYKYEGNDASTGSVSYVYGISGRRVAETGTAKISTISSWHL